MTTNKLDKKKAALIQLCKRYTAAALTAALTPSTKDMAAILVIPRIANSEKVQDVGNRLYDLAVEWAEELRTRKKEGGER